MYKNQLQELAQRSCFNLPSYSCIREGPDHAPRFKAAVNFNGETFESPNFCTTLRQAEHAAAEVALNALSKRGPSRSLAARVLDETGVYKNLLQETAHRAGLNLPVYTTVRSGPGHTPVFMCTVELAGMSFTGDPAKTKKQAQKNAAMAAWSALKQLPHLEGCSSSSSSPSEIERNEEQEQVIVARALAKLHSSDGNKPTQQNDRQSGRHKQLPVWREANLANNAPFYSVMPCQGWVHSNFFPEISMYHTWHQDSSPRQQGHFLTLPLSAPNDPRSSYMQASMQNVQGQYFRFMEQNFLSPLPSYVEAHPMYFPVYPSHQPEDRSLVSIQEIQEEKSVLGETGWFPSSIAGSDVNPSNHDDDVRTSNLDCKFEVSDQSLPVDNTPKPKAPECHDRQTIFTPNTSEIPPGGITTSNSSFHSAVDISYSSVVCDPSSSKKMCGTSHQEVKRDKCEQMNSEWGPKYRSPSHLSFVARNAGMYGTTQSVGITLHPPDTGSSGLLQGSRPPHRAGFATSRASSPVYRTGVRSGDFRSRVMSMAPPVTIRTATPVCSARPGGSNSNLHGLSSNVPSVHIRTVQPVCSAPVRTVTSVQRRTQEAEGISTAASEFSKLQI